MDKELLNKIIHMQGLCTELQYNLEELRASQARQDEKTAQPDKTEEIVDFHSYAEQEAAEARIAALAGTLNDECDWGNLNPSQDALKARAFWYETNDRQLRYEKELHVPRHELDMARNRQALLEGPLNDECDWDSPSPIPSASAREARERWHRINALQCEYLDKYNL